jgi:hypothetical protein
MLDQLTKRGRLVKLSLGFLFKDDDIQADVVGFVRQLLDLCS